MKAHYVVYSHSDIVITVANIVMGEGIAIGLICLCVFLSVRKHISATIDSI